MTQWQTKQDTDNLRGTSSNNKDTGDTTGKDTGG